jgi:Fur family iron response transcriptional regulator
MNDALLRQSKPDIRVVELTPGVTGLTVDMTPASLCTDDRAIFEISDEAQAAIACPDSYADGAKTGCIDLLLRAGLKPTRQRVILGELLFSKGDRHVTADMLYAEARDANARLSLATVYNTLNQFTWVGLLRRIGADGSRSFFDTNTTVHPHFYLHGEDILLDIPEPDVVLASMPEALPGYEVSRVDVIIHLRRKQR